VSASRIFISYRHSDSAGYAGRLHDRLQQRYGDAQVFMDLEMEYGIDFVERIDEAVNGSAVMLVMIGPNWLHARNDADERRLDDPNDFVRIEVSSALARATRVVPVLVGTARMPNSDDLPAPMQALARRNALELSDSRWDYDFGRLVQTVDAVINAPEPLTSEPAVTPPPEHAARLRADEAPKAKPAMARPSEPRRRRVAVLAGAGVVAVLIAVAVIAFRHGEGSSLKTVHLGASTGPAAITVDPSRDTLWVVEQNKPALAEIALPKLTVEHVVALPAGSRPTRVIVDVQGIVWLSDPDQHRLIRVDASGSGGRASAVPVDATPRGITPTADHELFVADSTGRRVIRVDAGGETRAAWDVPGKPRALSPGGGPRVLWLTDPFGGNVIRLDTTGGQPLAFDTGGTPEQLALDPAGKLWVTDRVNDQVIRISYVGAPAELRPRPVKVGDRPSAIAIGGGIIWVANAGAGSVTQLSYHFPWDRLRPDTKVGGTPAGIAASGSKAWVTDSTGGTVTEIDSASK
jgi:streptogramin lyase